MHIQYCKWELHLTLYNAFNVYCRELAPGTVSLTGDRAQGDDSKHCAYSRYIHYQQFLQLVKKGENVLKFKNFRDVYQ